MRPREAQDNRASDQATTDVREQVGRYQLCNDCGTNQDKVDVIRRQAIGDHGSQGAQNHTAAKKLLDDHLATSHCEGFNGVRNHASGTQKEENHVDNVREIRPQKGDAHVKYHNGESQAELRLRRTTINNKNSVQEVDGGLYGGEANIEDTYPWFSSRVICH